MLSVIKICSVISINASLLLTFFFCLFLEFAVMDWHYCYVQTADVCVSDGHFKHFRNKYFWLEENAICALNCVFRCLYALQVWSLVCHTLYAMKPVCVIPLKSGHIQIKI